MIWMFLAVALLCAAHMPSAPPREPSTEELRIGDVAEVADIDVIKDANADNGWYKKTKGGWIFWPEKTVDGNKPPKAELAAFANGEMMESVVGLLCLTAPLVLVVRVRRRKKKRGGVPQNGVSQVQYQSLMRQLSGMARILESVVSDEDGSGVKVTERRKRR